MANEQAEKIGDKPIIETKSEQEKREAREAAQAAKRDPEVAHEGGNPLGTDHSDSEAQAPDKSEELVVEGKGPERQDPVQTGNGTWKAIVAFWNSLGNIVIYEI